MRPYGSFWVLMCLYRSLKVVMRFYGCLWVVLCVAVGLYRFL